MERKQKTAMDILAAIERDVNEGVFDKALYQNDIKRLKGQVQELGLLKNTLNQLKDHLPQYANDVRSMQDEIEEIEGELGGMVEKEAEQTVRVNDGFNNLMSMISNRDPSRAMPKKDSPSTQAQRIKDKPTPASLLMGNQSQDLNALRTLKQGVLLRQLLNLVDQQWVTGADFERLPELMGVTELAPKIFVLTEVGVLLRLIPEEMFANAESKQNMINAAQECLDGFIEDEADAEILGLAEVEQGFGIVGEVTTDLGFVTSMVSPDYKNNHEQK